jgi:hypothetical protein
MRSRHLCGLAFAAALLSAQASAQPAQPLPTHSIPVRVVLAAAPTREIANGLIRARIALIDGAHGFYRGTRFDQAGVVLSLKLGAREFYGPWFDAVAPQVLDYVYDAQGKLVAGPDTAVSGPVEEFEPLDFTPTPKSRFVKIGVGVLDQPDTAPYDHYRHYRIVDGGQRSLHVTPVSIGFTQTLKNGETSYVYEKTLALTPGKTELTISHALTNTGIKPIHTSVYDHNFLRVAGRDNGLRIVFPFPVKPVEAPPADLIRVDDGTLTYLRAMRPQERLALQIKDFGTFTPDYDFRLRDTDEAGVHVTGDRRITEIHVFSLDTVQAIEPHIAVDVEPGKTMRWTYRYDFTGP